MEQFKVGELEVEPGVPIMMEGSDYPQLYTVLRGLGLGFKRLDADRRQVVNFFFPGDFIGLQAGMLDEMGHSVQATTQMTLCIFDKSELWGFLEQETERTLDIARLASIGEKFLGDAVTSIGQCSAQQSVAWALARIYLRGEAVGLVTDTQMQLPFKQRDLADALGLSLVHTNKSLKALEKQKLVRWTQGVLFVPDIAALATAAGSNPYPPTERPLI